MNRVVFILSSLCMLVAGCSSGSSLPGDSGTVTGTVMYKGKPVPAGSSVVMVHREHGIVATGATDQNGRFSSQMRRKRDLLVGEYGVHIVPPGELDDQNIGKPTMENVPDTWKEVPMKYWSLKDSPEKFVVKPGANTYNLVLED